MEHMIKYCFKEHQLFLINSGTLCEKNSDVDDDLKIETKIVIQTLVEHLFLDTDLMKKTKNNHQNYYQYMSLCPQLEKQQLKEQSHLKNESQSFWIQRQF